MTTVVAVRRIVAFGACLVPLLGVAPVGAHTCVLPAQVAVGVPIAVTVGVPAESQPVAAVDMEVPEGFEVNEVNQTLGWRVVRDGSTWRFRDGLVPSFSCGYITLRGVAHEHGELAFPLTLRTAGGEAIERSADHPGGPQVKQVVFAGVELDTVDDEGTNPMPVILGTLVGGGLIAAALAAARGVGGLSRSSRPRRAGR